jgi:hypothetical protein
VTYPVGHGREEATPAAATIVPDRVGASRGAEERLRERTFRLGRTALSYEHRGFIAVSALAVVVILLITQDFGFWRDEWAYIRHRSFADPSTWLLPHVEHFVALHAAVYTALLAIFGTSTYLPFHLVAIATHVAFVASIYALVDRHSGRAPALVVAVVLLLLGTAAINLVWAFQMGPMASGALAMWGLVVVRQRPKLAALLMSLAVATQGFALFILPAAAVYGRSRTAMLAAAVPALVYGIWYLLIGRAAVVEHSAALTIEAIVEWVPGGFGASAAALTGLGPFGILALVAILPLLRRLRDPSLAIVGIVGLLTEYVILGLTRQGLNVPWGQQYLYFGVAFLALVFAAAWPVVPRWGRPVMAWLAVVAIVTNVFSLFGQALFVLPDYMATFDPLCALCSGP